MIIASVVFPRPGGPLSNTWSGVRPRARAAWSTSESCSQTRSCPITSARVRGLSAASTATSSSRRSAAVNRSSVSGALISGPAQCPQGGAQERADVGFENVGIGRDRVDRLVRLAGRPAQAHQALADLAAPGRLGGRRKLAADRRTDPVLELEDDPLRA